MSLRKRYIDYSKCYRIIAILICINITKVDGNNNDISKISSKQRQRSGGEFACNNNSFAIIRIRQSWR